MSSISTALSVVESAKLENHEVTIAEGLQHFVAVGRALMAIRDEGLYRNTYQSFEAYCKERWGLSRPRAYQLIDAADACLQIVDTSEASEISDKPPLPTHESQVRPLTRLPVEEQAPAWREAVHAAPNGKPTAREVEQVVNQRLGKPPALPAPAPSSFALSTPTPQEEAKADAARRWSENLRKIYQLFNSTRDAGGLKKLTRLWPKDARADYVAELRRITGELNTWIDLMEKVK